MLPEAVSEVLGIDLSEVLGIDLSEVLSLYFGELDDAKRGRLIEHAIERRRTAEEGEEWLAEEAHRRSVIAELVHRGADDMF
jgi:hypothetical protein